MCPTSTQNKGKYGTRSKARLGLFFHQKSPPRPCTGTKKRSGQRAPPLGPCLQRGSKAALGFAPPPAGRASALAGDPSPWPAPAAFDVRRPGMAAARTAATLFKGGGGVAACSPLSIASGGTREKRQHCGRRQGVRPLCASDSPWARPGVRTGRAGNLRPASAPPVTVLGFSPPAPPLGG